MTLIVWLISLYMFIGITGTSLRLTRKGNFRSEFRSLPNWDAKMAWYFAQVLCWWTVFGKRKIEIADKSPDEDKGLAEAIKDILEEEHVH